VKFGFLTRRSFGLAAAMVGFGNALELHNLIAKGAANHAAQGMGAELAEDKRSACIPWRTTW
jgi:hypothetical protein